VLDERDSGEPDAPIRWRGGSGGNSKSRLSGGVSVPVSSFTSCSVPSGIKGVVKASLTAVGFNASTLGQMASPAPTNMAQLYVNGKPMTIARSPNIAEDGTWMWYGYENLKGVVGNTSFVLTDEAVAEHIAPATKMPGGLWLHGFWKFDWRDTFIKIDSVTKQAGGGQNGSVVTRDPATPPQYPFTDGARFYAVNSLQFLDAPNEYFIDVEEGMLYFKPSAPLADGATDVTVSMLATVVDHANANHVSFENLIISDARESAMVVTVSNDVNVTGSTVSNAGGSCISMSGVQHANVGRNTVFGCGRAGISISSGNTQTLAPGNSSIVGNQITNFSLITRTYEPGVAFQGVGLYVANNTVTHGPHTAMTGGGDFHLFEHNTIKDMCFETIDTGAFYVGRSWSQRGNVARFNTFDTIRATERLAQASCSQNAFYLDDQMSGWEFYNNTIINASTGVLLGGGRRNSIRDNVFINNDNDVHFDNRGQTWQLAYCRENCTDNKGLVQKECFNANLKSLKYTQPPYSTTFPELLSIYEDHPCMPVYNTIEGNTYCHAKSKDGGNFIDVTPEVAAGWHSTVANNNERC